MRVIWILMAMLMASAALLTAGTAQAGKDKPERVNFSTMTNVLSGDVEMAVETNNWKTCVENWERGLYQLEVFSATGAAVGGYSLLYGSTNFNSIQFNGDIIIGKCGAEHVKDYPKVTHKYSGVQKVRTYTRVIAIEGKTVNTQWRIYSYPHEKITATTTVKLVKQTSVATNVVEASEPHDCDLCGREVQQ